MSRIRLSLTAWIFIGMAAGIAIGIGAPGFASQLSPVSNIFLRLIRSVIAPLIFGTLVYGIAGSGDGSTWNPKPIVSFPQKFYRGEQPLLLDLRGLPEIKFVRAHWEVNRWGRGSTTPMFEFQLRLKEVPPDILQQASLEAKIHLLEMIIVDIELESEKDEQASVSAGPEVLEDEV